MLVAERIDYIQTLFRGIHENPVASDDPIHEVGDFLPEYISVLYEARSAQLAAKDLNLWKTFFERFAEQHRSQLLVGLGWTLEETGNHAFFDTFSASSDRWRTADGCGYYSGLFKRREAVRQQLVPAHLPPSLLEGFDQGLGRSFWYLMQGEPERIRDLIAHFPTERHAALWRGVGLAMTYVGGANVDLIERAIVCADTHLPSLKCGVLLALDGRAKTGTTLGSDQLLKEKLHLPVQVDFNRSGEFSEVLSYLEKSLAGG